jgi:hypothetical protein
MHTNPAMRLDQQRKVINDIHKRVVAVSKRAEKTGPLNLTKQSAGSDRSGCSTSAARETSQFKGLLRAEQCEAHRQGMGKSCHPDESTPN